MVAAPIVIVGGGPAGMVLAMNLAVFGVRSTIVNTESSSRWHPKGNTHNCRTMEHYRRLGLADALRRLGLPADHPTDVGYFTTLNGWELARHRMPSEREKMAQLAQAGTIDQIPEPLLRANQMYVEAHLHRHIQTLPEVDLRYGCQCVDIVDRPGAGFAVTIEEMASGRRETLDCDYLVGCDGGHSFVRRWLGISYGGERPRDQAYGSGATVSTHLRAPALYQRIVRRLCWQYWTVSPRVRSNLVTLDGAGEFLFNTRIRSVSEPPDPQYIARMFLETVGEEIDFAFIGHWPWTAGQALVADRFGEGRACLAGDAVHLFTPTGGFGMNTGIDDVANLGWKLAAMVQRWGGPDLLATYATERRPIAFRNTAMAKQFSRTIGDVQAPAEMLEETAAGAAARAQARDVLVTFGEEFASIGIQLGARYDGSPIIVADATTPPKDDPTRYRPSACPGGRAPHIFMPDGSSLFDHFGPGFTLLRFHRDHDAGPLAAAAMARGIPFTTFDVAVPEGHDLYERDLALIRPDQYVAWRGNGLPVDCGALLARVTGHI